MSDFLKVFLELQSFPGCRLLSFGVTVVAHLGSGSAFIYFKICLKGDSVTFLKSLKTTRLSDLKFPFCFVIYCLVREYSLTLESFRPWEPGVGPLPLPTQSWQHHLLATPSITKGKRFLGLCSSKLFLLLYSLKADVPAHGTLVANNFFFGPRPKEILNSSIY